MSKSFEEGFHSRNQSSDIYQEKLKLEPEYQEFSCPLTKEVMRDPVTIESGCTFEREAIEKWFKECKDSVRRPICPVTKKELKDSELRLSIVLRDIIKEWNRRNEDATLHWASRSLTHGSSEGDIMQALEYTVEFCQKNRSNKDALRKADLIPRICDMLKNSSGEVRSKALVTLCMVAEDDNNNKKAISAGDTIRTIIKFLTPQSSKEKEEAVSLLYELSKSQSLCEKLGEVNGAILILIGMASSKSESILSIEKAENLLVNLEKSEKNVKQMAENGRLQPLLNLLLEGSSETQLSMTEYLGELVLTNDVKIFLSQTAGSSLVDIMSSKNMRAREASLKALNHISSHDASAKLLIQAGLLAPLVKDLFTVGLNQLPTRLKEVSASIVANIVASGAAIDVIPLDHEGQTLVSENIVHSLLDLISNTGPAIECKLVQVLVGLTNSPSTVKKVVSAIRSSGATISLIQFIEAQQSDLRMASLNLLHNISPFMGQDLAHLLHENYGHLCSLIKIISDNSGILEEQVAAVGLLANLPERDSGITNGLLDEKAFNLFISKLFNIQFGETRGNRFINPFLEGLVKILSRLTYVVQDEPQVLALARELNLGSVFSGLLQMNVLDKVQKAAALSLNLSEQSQHLTIAEVQSSGFCFPMFSCFSKRTALEGRCKVHHGICSMRESFCLVEGKVVEKLVACLDHQNEELVESALAALCTLLEDGVDIEQGIQVLCDAEGITPILQIFLESKSGALRRRAVWSIERLLRIDDIARNISLEQDVVTALVEAFQRDDSETRDIAERALKQVDRLPNFSGILP